MTYIFVILILETPVTCIILIIWYSWTDHVILTCDLVFLWSCDYATRQFLIQDIKCLLYSYHNIHALSYCTWSIILIIPIVVITFNSRYCQTYCSYCLNALLVLVLHFHILSFTILFPLCLIGPLLMDLYYFSISISKSQYRELIIEHILVQLFSVEFSFFSWLVIFRYSGWYYYDSVFHICVFISVLDCICVYVCYPAHNW